jgi:hypothetical protein
MGQVAKELSTESALPLAPSVPQDLAKNILFAQAHASYGSPESLDLSIESVLRAISLYVWSSGPVAVTSESAEPIVWAQSRTAINPDATVVISPASINFGEAPVQTPEPEVWILMLLGLAGSMIWAKLLSSAKVALEQRRLTAANAKLLRRPDMERRIGQHGPRESPKQKKLSGRRSARHRGLFGSFVGAWHFS